MKHYRTLIALLLTAAVLLPVLTACREEKADDQPQTVQTTLDALLSGEEIVPETAPEEDVPAYNGIRQKSAKPIRFAFHNGAGDNTRSAFQVNENTEYGMRFCATAPFDSLSASCPSYSDNVGSLTFSLYKWEKDYDTTLKGQQLAGVTFKDFGDNETLTMDIAEQQPGEYLFLLSDGSGGVGIWKFGDAPSGTYLYERGLESQGCFTAWVNYTYTPEQMFVQVKPMLDLSYTVYYPDEAILPEDHPIHTLDPRPDTWVADDGLGRTLSTAGQVGEVREDKVVGMFFWTWHCSHSDNKPINVNEITDAHPDAVNDYNHEIWAENQSGANHWNEPVYGYYDIVDRWVIRNQAELLADAGVDVVIFDNTNGTYTWREGYTAVFEVFAEAREDGVNTPKIAFLLPFAASADARTQLRDLYIDIYRPGKFQDQWFYWEGKPFIMAHSTALDKRDTLDKEIANFFTFRAGQPVYNAPDAKSEKQWGWLSVYPQTVYYNKDGSAEMTTVGVAQNWSAEAGLTAMNGENVFGRAYSSKGVDTRENAELYGANFAEQWEYALEVDPEFVFVTGWNEWVAGRYESWGGVENAFPDQYNDGFSRDIEPSAGDLKDHYYYQLVDYIRRFKGARTVENAAEQLSIDIHGDISQWDSVALQYLSYRNNTGDRDADGYGTLHYTNNTGRNDIVSAKVARDAEYIYFLVETNENLTAETDNAWMRLFIDIAADQDWGWESFNYVVGRTGYRDGRVTVEKSTGGWNWTAVGEAEYTVSGKALQLKIRRADLGIAGGAFTANFKWSDNMQTDGDIMDFYINGDVAPGGRFKYQYNAAD